MQYYQLQYALSFCIVVEDLLKKNSDLFTNFIPIKMMKEKLILIILLFISTASFGKEVYSITKSEFSTQFNENHYLQTVYCQNKKGKNVWLHCSENTILILSLKENKTEKLMLHTIKFKQGIIEAAKFNVWIPIKKISNFDINDVMTISIECIFQEYETPYFNIDSSRTIAKHKNDSLRSIYNNGSEFIAILKNKKNIKGDTLKVIENACYDLTFNDGNKAKFGVIQKVTRDSIYISNFFNLQMAVKNKKKFETFGYLMTEIKEIKLLKSGGYSYRTIKFDDCVLSVENKKRNANSCPYWFAINPTTGDVNFYRLWQTDGKFLGIKEKNGNPIWYEGEQTE